MENPQIEHSSWTFLTNHSHVLLCLAKDSSMKMRQIAEAIGITERAVQRIIADLEKAGYLSRVRTGRCNTYQIDMGKHLRHRIEKHSSIRDMIAMVHAGDAAAGKTGEEV